MPACPEPFYTPHSRYWLSRSTFSRQFTELTGITAVHYLTLWRMHTALTRLKAGNRDLHCVAREVG